MSVQDVTGVRWSYLYDVQRSLLVGGANEDDFNRAGVVLCGPVDPVVDLQQRRYVDFLI